jgi:hypothetical protein
VNVFFSHDEYIDFFAKNINDLADMRTEFATEQPAGGVKD